MLLLVHTLHDRQFVRKLYRCISALGVTAISPEGFEICRRHPLSYFINNQKKFPQDRRDLIGIILSPKTIHSRWCQRDLRQALVEENHSDSKIILPLLYRKAIPPAFLQDHQFFNFSRSYFKTLAQMVALLNKVEVPSQMWGNFKPNNFHQVNQFFEQVGWEVIPALTWLDVLKSLEEFDRGGIHISLQPGLKKKDLDKKWSPKGIFQSLLPLPNQHLDKKGYFGYLISSVKAVATWREKPL